MIILITCGGSQHSHSRQSLSFMDIPATMGSVMQFAKATDRMKESTVIQNKWVSVCILVFVTQTACTVTNWLWHHASPFNNWYLFSPLLFFTLVVPISAFNRLRALKVTTLSTRWQTMSELNFIASYNKWKGRLMDNKFSLLRVPPNHKLWPTNQQ